MEWIKKHTDTVIVLGAILSSILWMNSKFNDVEKDLTEIKTVLIVKGIYPEQLCKNKIDSKK